LALLTAIALLLPSGAVARTYYFCRMMDRAQSACCCAGERASHDAVRRAELRRPDCCEQVAKPARATASTSLDPALDVPKAALATLLPIEVWVGEALSATNAAPRQARAPPGVGPPLFITHCSFLS